MRVHEQQNQTFSKNHRYWYLFLELFLYLRTQLNHSTPGSWRKVMVTVSLKRSLLAGDHSWSRLAILAGLILHIRSFLLQLLKSLYIQLMLGLYNRLWLCTNPIVLRCHIINVYIKRKSLVSTIISTVVLNYSTWISNQFRI